MSASFGSTSFTPDQLVLRGPDVTRKVTILSGAGVVARGTVLGKVANGAATSAAKSGGNTGNGTLTMDVTTPVKAGAKLGVYKVRFTVAASNNGSFIVTDPDGYQLGVIVMAAGAGTFDDDLKFALADGSTDFIVGDGFDITVAGGSGKYIKSLSAAADGSQVPDCILAETVDATSADVDAPAYFKVEVNEASLILGTGHTAASIKEGLRLKGIDLITVQTTY